MVVRLAATLKRAAGSCQWRKIDEHLEAGELIVQRAGWSRERRFGVIRECVREGSAAAGRNLIHVHGCTYRFSGTNRPEAAKRIWHHITQLHLGAAHRRTESGFIWRLRDLRSGLIICL